MNLLFSKNISHHTKSLQSIDEAKTDNKKSNFKKSKISNTSNSKKSSSSKNQNSKISQQKDTSQTISTPKKPDEINNKNNPSDLVQSDLAQEESKIDNKDGNITGIETDFDGDFKTFGLFWQYQMYFGEFQKHGFKTTSHIATYIQSQESYNKEEPNLMSVGFDIKYLYDFWSKGSFVLGINAGIGYQQTFLFASKKYEANRNSLKSSEAISNRQYGFVGIVGTHIYYGRYQVEILSGYPNYFRVTLGIRY